MTERVARAAAVSATFAGVLVTLGSDQLSVGDTSSSSSSGSSSDSSETGVAAAFWVGGIALQGGVMVDGWLGMDWWGVASQSFVCQEESKTVESGTPATTCPDCDYAFLVTAGTVSDAGDACSRFTGGLPGLDIAGNSYGFGWGGSTYTFGYNGGYYTVDYPVFIYSPEQPDYGWLLFAYSYYPYVTTYVGDGGMSFQRLFLNSYGYPLEYTYAR